MNRPGRSNALILFVFLVLSTIVYAYDFLTDAGDSVGYGKCLGENINAQNQSLMILTGTTGYGQLQPTVDTDNLFLKAPGQKTTGHPEHP